MLAVFGYALTHWQYHEQLFIEQPSLAALTQLRNGAALLQQTQPIFADLLLDLPPRHWQSELSWLEGELAFFLFAAGIVGTGLLAVPVLAGSVGYALGAALTEGWKLWLLIPLAMLMGWFIINAEPAVHTLNKQVEELSAGAISAKAMGMSLSIAVSAAGGLAMLRVIPGQRQEVVAAHE